eukprot:365376-Chlamydomonas_euryale.AAC.3
MHAASSLAGSGSGALHAHLHHARAIVHHERADLPFLCHFQSCGTIVSAPGRRARSVAVGVRSEARTTVEAPRRTRRGTNAAQQLGYCCSRRSRRTAHGSSALLPPVLLPPLATSRLRVTGSGQGRLLDSTATGNAPGRRDGTPRRGRPDGARTCGSEQNCRRPHLMRARVTADGVFAPPAQMGRDYGEWGSGFGVLGRRGPRAGGTKGRHTAVAGARGTLWRHAKRLKPQDRPRSQYLDFKRRIQPHLTLQHLLKLLQSK